MTKKLITPSYFFQFEYVKFTFLRQNQLNAIRARREISIRDHEFIIHLPISKHTDSFVFKDDAIFLRKVEAH